MKKMFNKVPFSQLIANIFELATMNVNAKMDKNLIPPAQIDLGWNGYFELAGYEKRMSLFSRFLSSKRFTYFDKQIFLSKWVKNKTYNVRGDN